MNQGWMAKKLLQYPKEISVEREKRHESDGRKQDESRKNSKNRRHKLFYKNLTKQKTLKLKH